MDGAPGRRDAGRRRCRRWTRPAPASGAGRRRGRAAAGLGRPRPGLAAVRARVGLLLVGLVADGRRPLRRRGPRAGRAWPRAAWCSSRGRGAGGGVTSLLNLDTSVAFLTPVLVYAARSRGEGEAPLLYGCLLLSNAASLLLPGSNLTNLIVLGHLHLSGGRFLGEVAPAARVGPSSPRVVVGAAERRSLRTPGPPPAARAARLGVGPGGGGGGDRAACWPCGPRHCPWRRWGVAAGRRGGPGRLWARVLGILGMPLLVGLFGVAVALGTLGRAWSGPAAL